MTIADPTAGSAQQIAWLRLNALEFAPKRVHALLEFFDGSPEIAFSQSESAWRQALPDLTSKQLERLRKIRDQDFSKEIVFLERSGGRAVPFTDPDYPANLKPLPDAPPVLIVRGSFVSEDKFSVAIVGSRRASSYGLSLARRFAAELADRGLTVVSGGARGVDTQAHLGALDAKGRTIAYLGCGADINYPSENRTLFDNIVTSGGAVVSEFPLGTRPEPWRFPARNRLISGTALGVPTVSAKVSSANKPGLKKISAPLFLPSLNGKTFSITEPVISRLVAPGTCGDVSAMRTSASMSVMATGFGDMALPRLGCTFTLLARTPRCFSRSCRRAAISAKTA
ncbi:DNA-processing protein DprA [Capsulimonas corticalis]|uniref:DNA-processing protein DprA n=1 Tax=Capsulimonas corticalis TaxID=2219043 RepID=UPI00339DA4FC